MSPEDARRSVTRARTHLEAAGQELVRQVEGRAWEALGYGSWDEMREAEYGGPVVIPERRKRPELVNRLRSEGLTQQQIGATLGASDRRVRDDLRSTGDSPVEHPQTIRTSRGDRPARYERKSPPPDTEWSRQARYESECRAARSNLDRVLHLLLALDAPGVTPARFLETSRYPDVITEFDPILLDFAIEVLTSLRRIHQEKSNAEAAS